MGFAVGFLPLIMVDFWKLHFPTWISRNFSNQETVGLFDRLLIDFSSADHEYVTFGGAECVID